MGLAFKIFKRAPNADKKPFLYYLKCSNNVSFHKNHAINTETTQIALITLRPKNHPIGYEITHCAKTTTIVSKSETKYYYLVKM